MPPPVERVFVPPALSPRLLTSASRGPVQILRGETMGTTWQVRVVHEGATDDLLHAIVTALQLIIDQMSTWKTDSDVSRFNRAPPGAWHSLPPECFDVLLCGLNVAQLTGGAYDPTIGTLVDLWGYGPRGSRSDIPGAAEVTGALRTSGWRRLQLDCEHRRALQAGGLRLDFSSIAKGYAVDRVAAALDSCGCHNYLVEIGGELRGAGCKSDGTPWWVELEGAQLLGEARMLVALHDLSSATSGDYRRFFEANGQRLSHTIDPRTGWPITNDVAAVTVLCERCMDADAWATALTVLGVQQGIALATQHDIAALFIQRRGHEFVEHLTPALCRYLD